MRHGRLGILLAGLQCGFLWAPCSGAQEPEVQEVIVTAQKRSESIQEVPAAITAFTSDTIRQSGIRDVADLQFHIPSLMFGSEAGLTKITLRGIGLNTSTGEIEGGVAVHVDGIYQPHPATGDQGQLDVERIEVLRGPQGTLYGRNATGGAVNFITAPPSDSFEGHVQAEYASYEAFRAGGKLSGPLSERVRASLATEYNRQNEGFIENVAGGPDLNSSRKLSGRLKLAIDLTPQATLDLSFFGFDEESALPYAVAAYPAAPELVAIEPRLAGATYTFEPWRTTNNSPSTLERSSYSGSATLTWKIGEATFTSRSSYQVVDEDYIQDADGASADYDQFLRRDRMNNFIQEFNIAGSRGRLDMLGGAFLMHEDFDIYAALRFPNGTFFGVPPGFELPFGYRLKATSWAGFFDATMHVSDRLRLIAGGRYTNDSRTAYQDLFGGACVASTKVKGDKVTGRGVLQFDLSEDANVYGSVSTGYRNGGVAYSECQSVYDPETITSYELGYKARFGRAITFNAAAFYYDYTNLQFNQQRTNNGQLIVSLVNVPEARIKGIEFETVVQPNEHWRLDLAASFLDARYGTFFNVDSQLPDKNLGLQEITGNRLNYSPEWSGAAGVQYTSAPIRGAGTLTARLECSFSDEYFFREFNTPAYTQSGYALGNAFLTWDAMDRYSVRLWVKNIGDKAIVRSLIAQDTVGTNLITFNNPRQIGLDVNIRF